MLCRWPTAFSNNLCAGCVCSVSKCSVKEKTVSMSCKVTDESVAEQQQSITEATMLHLLKTQATLLPTCGVQWRGLAAELAAILTQFQFRCTDLYVWPTERQAEIRRGKQDEATTVSISPQLQLWTSEQEQTLSPFTCDQTTSRCLTSFQSPGCKVSSETFLQNTDRT